VAIAFLEAHVSENPERRFSLADAMVLVAAMAPGLILLRTAVALELFNLVPNLKAPPGRDFINSLSVSSASILGSLTLATLVLSFRKPRPNLREVMRLHGFVACVAVMAASLLPLVHFVIGVTTLSATGLNVALYFNNTLARLTLSAGQMIIGAWIALALMGRWRPGSNWKDRLGCVLRACWIFIYGWTELYFIMQPLRVWWTSK
jgi:hypothetical protein